MFLKIKTETSFKYIPLSGITRIEKYSDTGYDPVINIYFSGVNKEHCYSISSKFYNLDSVELQLDHLFLDIDGVCLDLTKYKK